jgi:sirohydrochlorin cobaltochelatase
LQQRYVELASKMRAWPRTPENDPFFAASKELAQQLSETSGYDVVLGFNEFCAPDLDAALDQAVDQGAEQVVVITPMMTRGGEHATTEIPNLVQNAQERHPQVEFIYAWPFAGSDVAAFLAEQIERFR